MLKYCLKCKKDIRSVDSKVVKTKNGRLMSSPKCTICGSKNSRFMKEQEAKRLLRSLGFRALLNKIPLLSDILF